MLNLEMADTVMKQYTGQLDSLVHSFQVYLVKNMVRPKAFRASMDSGSATTALVAVTRSRDPEKMSRLMKL